MDITKERIKVLLSVFMSITLILSITLYTRYVDHIADAPMRAELSEIKTSDEYAVRMDMKKLVFSSDHEYGLIEKDDYDKYLDGSDGDLVYKTNKGTVKRVAMNEISEIKILEE